jgi:diguanylate cyclase (GGDEF)-like protein
MGDPQGYAMSDPMNSSGKKRLLVVDDEPINVQILYQAFSGDYQVFMAKTGEQALAVAARTMPDLVLLDVSMPGLDGYEVCQRLKANEATKAIPVIFVSAYNDPVRESRGLEVGAVDFISKPVNPVLVRARVAMHIQLREQADRLRQQVLFDAATGAFNRRNFDGRAANEWARSKRGRRPLSVALFDVSTAHGRQLRSFAAVVGAHLRRPGDILARYEDKTLAALLPETDLDGAMLVVHNIGHSVQEAGLKIDEKQTEKSMVIQAGVAAWMATSQHALSDLLDQAQARLAVARTHESQRICGVCLE